MILAEKIFCIRHELKIKNDFKKGVETFTEFDCRSIMHSQFVATVAQAELSALVGPVPNIQF